MMKVKYVIALLTILATGAFAQNNDSNSYIIPTETDQQLFYYLIEKYQNQAGDQNLLLIYSPLIKGRVGILNVPINKDYTIETEINIPKPEIIHEDIENRLQILKEIVEYQKVITSAKQELIKLKQERDLIQKKLELMKSILYQKKKVKLNRIDK